MSNDGTGLREAAVAAIERLRAPALMFDSDRRLLAGELESALSAVAPPPVLEGWVLVPREPTEAMVNAARGFSVPGYCLAAEQWPSVYAAMIAASPAASAQPEGGEAVACHRLHTPNGKWTWISGPPAQGALDDAKNFGWTMEYAYTRPAPAQQAVTEDEDGMPVGYADWYNRKFAGQHVDTQRDHACEEAWRAALTSTAAKAAEGAK